MSLDNTIVNNVIENRIISSATTGNIFIWITIILESIFVLINQALHLNMEWYWLGFPVVAFFVVIFIGAFMNAYNVGK